MTDIRPAVLADLPGVYRVCLRTGDAGKDGTSLFRNPDLLGHVFVGPYVVGEPGHALVVADADGVAGYCLATPDTRRFAAWAEGSWWPPLRAQYPRRDDGTQDAEIVDLLHHPPIAEPAIVDAYPAHLHIDLLEHVRGTGTGRRLIDMQLGLLRAGGARACHLNVAASNTNAIAFYEHLGWHVIRRDDDDLTMGMHLA